jgi:hypothetical protein
MPNEIQFLIMEEMDSDGLKAMITYSNIDVVKNRAKALLREAERLEREYIAAGMINLAKQRNLEGVRWLAQHPEKSSAKVDYLNPHGYEWSGPILTNFTLADLSKNISINRDKGTLAWLKENDLFREGGRDLQDYMGEKARDIPTVRRFDRIETHHAAPRDRDRHIATRNVVPA